MHQEQLHCMGQNVPCMQYNSVCIDNQAEFHGSGSAVGLGKAREVGCYSTVAAVGLVSDLWALVYISLVCVCVYLGFQ